MYKYSSFYPSSFSVSDEREQSCSLTYTTVSQFTTNNLVANIGPCNWHLVLKQCCSFSQSFYPIICLNKLFKQIQSVSKSEICIFSWTAVQISCRNLCNLIGGYTKHDQTKIEFVQTTGQAVMHASQWLKLKHCLSTSWRLHGPTLPASMLMVCGLIS